MKCVTVLAMAGMFACSDAANVCFMNFQMADNDLETYIRDDLEEYTKSEAVRTPTLTSWNYFDHRNFGNPDGYDDETKPLVNVYNADGSEVTGDKTEFSQYLRWDHDLAKMVIDRTTDVEVDSDTSQAIADFFTVALQDCVDKNSTEFFASFSSHGSGYNGYGGDWHFDLRRRLVQTNQNIVQGLKTAIANVEGAPEKFDVLGFDACLMQEVGALDEYSEITDHLIASEAVEPGHGWAYNTLGPVDNALGFAEDILKNFITETQNSGLSKRFHDNPKTLAITDTSKYGTFAQALDVLGAEMKMLIESQDPQFYTQVHRARNNALSYESVDDVPIPKIKSAVDVGDFLSLIETYCSPEPSSDLQKALDSTQFAYKEMVISYDNGPGTSQRGTGVALNFPSKNYYHELGPDYWDEYLFQDPTYATTTTPEFLSFMQAFYAVDSPASGGASVCTLSAAPCAETEAGQLLINPSISVVLDNGGQSFETELAQETDAILLEYGMDVSPLMSQFVESRRGRRLSSSTGRDGFSSTRPGRRARQGARRSLQETQDYLLTFGGDVDGTYQKAGYSALWDRKFYIYTDEAQGTTDTLFASDMGDGGKNIPVVFMPSGSTVITKEILAALPLDITESAFAEQYGGQLGYLSFSTQNADENGMISEGFSLFSLKQSGSYAETPRLNGSQAIPVQYGEGVVDGVFVDTFIGGFGSIILDWSVGAADSFSVSEVTAEEALARFDGVENLIFDIFAFDDDLLAVNESDPNGINFAYFEMFPNGTNVLVAGDNVLQNGGLCEEESSAASVSLFLTASAIGSSLMMLMIM